MILFALLKNRKKGTPGEKLEVSYFHSLLFTFPQSKQAMKRAAEGTNSAIGTSFFISRSLSISGTGIQYTMRAHYSHCSPCSFLFNASSSSIRGTSQSTQCWDSFFFPSLPKPRMQHPSLGRQTVMLAIRQELAARSAIHQLECVCSIE